MRCVERSRRDVSTAPKVWCATAYGPGGSGRVKGGMALAFDVFRMRGNVARSQCPDTERDFMTGDFPRWL